MFKKLHSVLFLFLLLAGLFLPYNISEVEAQEQVATMLNTIFMINGSLGYAAGYSGILLKTYDSGENWNILEWQYSSNISKTCTDLFFINENEGWMMLYNGAGSPYIQYYDLYHTADGGVTWSLLWQSNTTMFIRDVYFFNESYGWGVGNTILSSVSYGAIYRTYDGGLTWEFWKRNSRQYTTAFELCALDEDHAWWVFEGDSCGVMYYDLLLEDWSQVLTGGHMARDLIFVNFTHGFVTTEYGSIFRSTDGGRTWSELPQMGIVHHHDFFYEGDDISTPGFTNLPEPLTDSCIEVSISVYFEGNSTHLDSSEWNITAGQLYIFYDAPDGAEITIGWVEAVTEEREGIVCWYEFLTEGVDITTPCVFDNFYLPLYGVKVVWVDWVRLTPETDWYHNVTNNKLYINHNATEGALVVIGYYGTSQITGAGFGISDIQFYNETLGWVCSQGPIFNTSDCGETWNFEYYDWDFAWRALAVQPTEPRVWCVGAEWVPNGFGTGSAGIATIIRRNSPWEIQLGTKCSFEVTYLTEQYDVAYLADSTITDFVYDVATNTIYFKVFGPGNHTGHCNVTIPKSIVSKSIQMKIDGSTMLDVKITQNTTHYFVYITYDHSIHDIETDMDSLLGDFNGDDEVDIFDIVMIADCYGLSEGETGYHGIYDVDYDGDIDIFDIVLVVGNYGEEA